MKYTPAIIRIFMVALVVAVFSAGAVAGAPQEDREQIVRAKDQMFEGNYAKAHELFRSIVNNPDSPVRDQALYYAAKCSYNLDSFERAKDEIRMFETMFDSSNWADDIAQLMNDVNRAMGETGDVESMLLVNTVELEKKTQELTRNAEQNAAQAAELAERGSLIEVRKARLRTGSKFDDEDCDDPDGRKEAALNALIHVEDVRALSVIKKFLATDPCDKLKVKAFFVLSQLDSEESMDILVEAARNEESMEVRKSALFWLGQFDDERASVIMVDMYDDVDDVATRKNIIFNLSQMEDERSVNKLLQIAKTEQNIEVRKAAIHWITQLHDEEKAIIALKDIYNNSSESVEVRKGVIFALHQLDVPEALNMLKELAKSEPNQELRKNAIFWIGQADIENAAEMLVDLYQSEPSLEIKSQIIFSMGNLDDVSVTTPRLEEFYRQADSVELRKKIIFTLHRIADDDDDAAVDLLISLYEAETNDELKKNIRFWLSQSDNPKAEEFLLEGLEADLIG